MREINIYTDGSCSGNPGPGGIGALLICNGHEKELSRFIEDTTSNRAEIQALIDSLEAIKFPARSRIIAHTDSQLLYGLLTLNWKLKKNLDLVSKVKKLVALCGEFEIRKVKAHSGHPFNERADRLAREGWQNQ